MFNANEHVTMVNVCFDRVIGLLHCNWEWLLKKQPREKWIFYHRLKMFNRQQTICIEQL